MTVEKIDRPFHVGYDRTEDVVALIPVSGDPYGPDICELVGICTAALTELGERMGTNQKQALKFVKQLL
jgi:hypothetical protein